MNAFVMNTRNVIQYLGPANNVSTVLNAINVATTVTPDSDFYV